MAPHPKFRALFGAVALGLASAGLVGCQILPEESAAAKCFKESKLNKHITESKVYKHFTESKAAKFLKESKLGKLKKLGEKELKVMPELTPPEKTPPPQSALNLAPGAPAPGPPTIWSKLGLSPEQREFRQRALAETPIGKLAGAVTEPLSKATLGIIPSMKPPKVPTLKELLDKGPIGAKSKVKIDKMNAKARKEAVEELKEVDCHYWPEAEEALIGALRTDRNEAVRYSAAKALAGGKCCTKKTIDALTVCASGSDRDGAPCEVSATVRAMAAKALEKCLESQCLNRCGVKYVEIPCAPDGKGGGTEAPRTDPEELPREPVQPAAVKPSPYAPETEEERRQVQMVSYYTRVKKRTDESVIATAKAVLAQLKFPPGADAVPAGHPDYEAVELYPDTTPAAESNAPTANSPRPEGLFDRPKAATGPPAAPAVVKPRDPSRPVNIFDMLSAPRTPANLPRETPEPPRAIPEPMPPRPAAVVAEERGK